MTTHRTDEPSAHPPRLTERAVTAGLALAVTAGAAWIGGMIYTIAGWSGGTALIRPPRRPGLATGSGGAETATGPGGRIRRGRDGDRSRRAQTASGSGETAPEPGDRIPRG
jgi:hypothetical protein